MPESSVDSYIAAQPEQAMSMDEYWQEYKKQFYDKPGYATKAPEHYNDLNYKIAKFFGHGAENSFESAYEAYLNNLNNRNEYLATQSARQWDKMMDDSKIQRSMKDYEAAGLNPYLLINSGSVGGGSAPTSSKSDYKSTHKKDDEKTNKTRDVALLILALSRVAAALL